MPKGPTKGQKFSQTNPGSLAAYHAEWLGKIHPDDPRNGDSAEEDWAFGTGADLNPGNIKNPVIWPRPKVGKAHGG